METSTLIFFYYHSRSTSKTLGACSPKIFLGGRKSKSFMRELWERSLSEHASRAQHWAGGVGKLPRGLGFRRILRVYSV